MATVKIQNVSPLGDLDVPILGRIVKAGEVVDVDDAIAGAVATGLPDADGVLDIGSGLLAQIGTWAPPAKSPTNAAPAPTPPPASTQTAVTAATEGE